MSDDPCIIAVDPGRAKCGLAVVNAQRRVLRRCIVDAKLVGDEVERMAREYRPTRLIIGDGTNSIAVRELIGARNLTITMEVVDESHTSEAARARYVAETPARGLRRLLPQGLRYPETPYDDFVAIILAERWWDRAVG